MKNTKYHIYKRGSIILVDFPKGIGNELTGMHLAIVLNKNDSYNNGVLTVIPLSSKEKPYYTKLGNLVNDVIGPELMCRVELLNSHLNSIKQNKELLVKKIDDVYDKALTEDNKQGVLKILPELDDKFQEYLDNTEQFKENLDQFQKVLNVYNKMNKGSFALVQNITTISKKRITRPINKLDPIGKIHLPNDLMDLIDSDIIRMYTK